MQKFGLFPFRSPLLRKFIFVSFPPGTEMFHFPGCASCYVIQQDHRGLLCGVSPFGDLRIKGCYTPPRSLSQLCHVLLRLLKSRHPPYALKFPVKKFINHSILCLQQNIIFVFHKHSYRPLDLNVSSVPAEKTTYFTGTGY